MPAIILNHTRHEVKLDEPRDEGSYPGLPVLGHSEPIHLEPPHVMALRGTLPAEHCGGCGEPNALHMDSTNSLFVGCDGVQARRVMAAMMRQSMRDTTVWGDQHPKVSSAIRSAMRTVCGPHVALCFETLGHEERINLSRRLAEIAVVAYLSGQTK